MSLIENIIQLIGLTIKEENDDLIPNFVNIMNKNDELSIDESIKLLELNKLIFKTLRNKEYEYNYLKSSVSKLMDLKIEDLKEYNKYCTLSDVFDEIH